ncbi:MAG: hypothetical protein LBN95_09680, partial [Prevotellaceae bacterium]|nr:hypothetical protein [Prevotellaceae bacterium]
DEAIAKLKVLEEKDPNFTLIYRELGDVYYDINKFKEAAECYEKYLKAGHSANIPDLVRYSMTLFFLKDYNKSIEVASSGLATNPRSPALNRLVLYNNFALKNYDLALQAADLLFNNSDGTKITYLDYDFYAKALRETNQYDLAKDEYLKAFALDTTQIEVIKEISEMYSSAKPADLKKSIEYYTQYANKLNGKAGVENIIALGKLYYQQGIDTVATPIADERLIALHNADSVFATAVEKYPENYLGNYWRAAANVALDPETKLGLAKPYYEATIDFALAKLDEEGNRDVRYNGTIIMCYGYLAYYYLLQNDMKSSTDYCNKILELDPNNARAKSTLDYIKSKKK